MKIHPPVALVCAVGILKLLAAGVFIGSSAEEASQGRRARSGSKFFGERTRTEWPFSGGSESAGYSATTTFKVLPSLAPDMFGTANQKLNTRSPNWIDLQVGDAVLNRAVKELNLAGLWGLSDAEAAARLRAMTTASWQEGTNVVSITVRSSDPARAADMANGVRNAYAASREDFENERVRRLIADSGAKIKQQEGIVAEAAATQSPPPRGAGHVMVTCEGQILLLDGKIVRKDVIEILEVAKPEMHN
jgi:hypothetical protein